jgi:hypothetical protein
MNNLLTISLTLLILCNLQCKKEKHYKFYENVYSHLFTTSPALNADNYPKLEALEKRVYQIQKLQKDFILELNKIDQFNAEPTEAVDFVQTQKYMSEIFKVVPKEIYNIWDKYVYGFYFCDNLGGSGITGIIQKNGKSVGAIILIDSKLIQQPANDWISYKENTVFTAKNFQLKIKIENPNEEKKYSALEYILLHETGHLLQDIENISPYFRDEYRNFGKYIFFKEMWKHENETLIADNKFPERNRIKFYSNDKLFLDTEGLEIYASLDQKTPFPTLYGATNPDDHFAESLVSYVHIFLQKKPWELEIKDSKGKVFTFQNGIEQDRSLKERLFIKSILEKY